MSKFSIKVKLQGLEIEVEGTKEDAPRIASQLGKQIGGLLQSPAALASGNGAPTIDTEIVEANNGAVPKKKTKRGGSGVTKTSADDFNLVHDPEKYGTPRQEWTQAQKAIWFLHIVGEQSQIKQQTSYCIAKNFNKYFKSSGQLNSANVMRGLERERQKSPTTVNADMNSGTAKYFLTISGTALAQKLSKGEVIAAE